MHSSWEAESPVQAEITADQTQALLPDLACWVAEGGVRCAERGVLGLILVMHLRLPAHWARLGWGTNWVEVGGHGPIEFCGTGDISLRGLFGQGFLEKY